MKVILLSLALGASLATPVSDAVPTWNVEASCKGAIAADKALNFNDVQTVDACMKDEQQARDELTKSWTQYTAPLRVRCEQEAGGTGPASYVDLIVCLQISSDTATKPTTAVAVNSLKGAGKHGRKPAAK